jgi:rhodanese-related sulfurtransferase
MASLLLYRAAALVAAGVIAGAVHSGIVPVMLKPEAPAPIKLPQAPLKPPEAPKDIAPPANPPPATPAADEMAGLNITLAQAKKLYDAHVPFVDARHAEEYESGHVQDAFQLSTEDFNGSEVLNYLDRDSPLVVYCSGGACDASKNLVKLLQQAGFKQARIMEDGYPAWEKAGYPTAKGKPVVGGGGK